MTRDEKWLLEEKYGGGGTAEYATDKEIGRAAWRGRGEISGGAVSLKKKHNNHVV